MKYFTADLLEKLNSPDAKQVARAHAVWDQSTERYERRLEAIRSQLAPGAMALADQCFHDAQVLNLSYQGSDKLALILRLGSHLYLVTFVLTDLPTLTHPEKTPRFASDGLLWLYEEVDMHRGKTEVRVLLSDGAELCIPFSDIAVSTFDVTPRSENGKASSRKRAPASRQSLDVTVFDQLTPVIPALLPPGDSVSFPLVVR